MANSISWKKIFEDHEILNHDFSSSPFILTSKMIKQSVQEFKNTAEKEVRILCKQDSRKDVPDIMKDNGLFLLPIKNGDYAIVKGEGYIDIPNIEGEPIIYNSKIDFELESSKVGNSEMQHLDFAYASSLIRTFIQDPTLVLTIRGRKYTPEFSFNVGNIKLETKSVQTEVDAGYEGKDKIVLIEAKNSKTSDTIIRQLFYPYKQWKTNTSKDVILLFFEKRGNEYCIWQYEFEDENNYNSVILVKTGKYKIL
ncbi:MAG: hypothetical protein Q8K30_04210 [Candidatus Gracilibacteria bacterium]|nr:hypothetical protein [Candidatus Gracilibacteria bacterium]